MEDASPPVVEGPLRSVSVVTMTVTPRDFEGLVVTEEEFEAATAGGSGVKIGFFGIAIGGAISFGIALLTVTPSTPIWQLALFVALLGVSVVLTAYFGMETGIEARRSKQRIGRILERARARAERLGGLPG